MNKRRTLLLIAPVVLLCAALISACMSSAPVSGQNITDQTTQINETLWPPGSSCRYVIVIEESSLITARLTGLSDDMDPVLTLIDEAGNTLTEDDDSGGNGDALIEDFPAVQPGRYTIVASSYGDEGAGPFELVVEIRGDE
jgi:hypothetical protein